MTHGDQITDMVAFARRELGRLDILVNNAGIQHVESVENFPTDQWEKIIAINLSSAFYATRAAIPIMKAQGRGRIVNMASAHGLVASPFKSAYVAAKHGIIGFTKTVALELARDNITCNAICPGFVETPIVAKQIADQARTRNMSEDQVLTDVILGRPADQAVRHDRGTDRHLPLSGQRPGRLGQWRQLLHRRRLDRTIGPLRHGRTKGRHGDLQTQDRSAGRHGPASGQAADLPGASGRGRTRRLPVGRAGTGCWRMTGSTSARFRASRPAR